jgi:hypothetical protein
LAISPTIGKRPRFGVQRLEKMAFWRPTIGNGVGFWFQRLEVFVIGLLLLLAWPGGAAASEAGRLMAQVRAALPAVPVTLEADLQERDRRGRIVRAVPMVLTWDWGARPPAAAYEVRDRFGEPLAGLRAAWPREAAAEYVWTAGAAAGQVATNLHGRVAGLDLTWADVTLPFLWWDDGEVLGSDRVRGRSCVVVALRPPAVAVTRYPEVRLWIDPETSLVMQADALDAEGAVVRRMVVKSLQKIDELWMIQNLDLLDPGGDAWVTLRVRNMRF